MPDLGRNLPVKPPIPPSLRRRRTSDLEQPRYARRIACQVSGVDVETLKKWILYRLFDVSKWMREGVVQEQVKYRQGEGSRRQYSTLDLMRLTAMTFLVRGGIEPRIAANAAGSIDLWLGSEDVEALERGEIPQRSQMLFVFVDGELRDGWFRPLRMPSSVYESPVEALGASELGAGILLDWSLVVSHVFDELKRIERGEPTQ